MKINITVVTYSDGYCGVFGASAAPVIACGAKGSEHGQSSAPGVLIRNVQLSVVVAIAVLTCSQTRDVMVSVLGVFSASDGFPVAVSAGLQ